MGDPHRPDRYGEVWNQHKLDTLLSELTQLKHLVTISGGWAWHFYSPPHTEYKHLHDHKDLDLFVQPARRGELIALLRSREFDKVSTKYDHLPSDEDFKRYEKFVGDVKVTIDLFVRDVPAQEVDGWSLVEPSALLAMYRINHSSKQAFAVQAARALLERGQAVAKNPELIRMPL